jgi:hypothetical protein
MGNVLIVAALFILQTIAAAVLLFLNQLVIDQLPLCDDESLHQRLLEVIAPFVSQNKVGHA